jgi:hypothetical protein
MVIHDQETLASEAAMRGGKNIVTIAQFPLSIRGPTRQGDVERTGALPPHLSHMHVPIRRPS